MKYRSGEMVAEEKEKVEAAMRVEWKGIRKRSPALRDMKTARVSKRDDRSADANKLAFRFESR